MVSHTISTVLFLGALKSHFTLLNDLGTGKYDRDLVAKKNLTPAATA